MEIYLNKQAENYLKINKTPNNSGGIFYSNKDNCYIWWLNNQNGFDCGEEINFNKSFNKLKNNGRL